jgi:hypothetical protein
LGGIKLVSSYGIDQSQLGPEFPAIQLYSSERARTLKYRESFYTCRQHDWKLFDWNGAMRQPVKHPTQPLIGSAVPEFYVPLSQRRPNSPYRLARVIVGAFTTLVFGHGRWPNILSDDPKTQDFAQALINECKLKTKMIRARNLGGSSGTVGLSWYFRDGAPRVRVHSGKHISALQWDDEDELIPTHVTELYQYPKDVWNPDKKRYERRLYWHRRDWTEMADVEFVPCEVAKENPIWQIDEEKSVMHNDGFCHFVWIQNMPDDDTVDIDGLPDYPELYEQFDTIDVLNSANTHGTASNLDPTLVLRMHQEDVGGAIIKKGSDNALVVGASGDAKYLELGGSATKAGKEVIEDQRSQALESSQCVVPDPNEVVGSATSSVALKIVYAPMLSKGDVIRDQYGEGGILRLIDQMIKSARSRNVGGLVEEQALDENGLPIFDEHTNEPVYEQFEYVLKLPPAIEEVEVKDEEGNGTGEMNVVETPRVPGNGTLRLEWPDYFKETADDKQKNASALTAATAGKPVLSQQTAVEIHAVSMQRDAQIEWSRIRKEQDEQRASEAAMFPGIGGEVGSINELPPGAEPEESEESDGGSDEGAAG